MLKLIIGNSSSKIVGHLPKNIQDKIDYALSFVSPAARFSKKYKEGRWDGRIRYYQKYKGQSFLTGMLSIVSEILTANNVTFKKVDNRSRPEQNIPFLNFEGPAGFESRDYQLFTVERAVSKTRGLLKVATGGGKCLGKGTPVLMFDGITKAVEDIRVGDSLMGPDYTPRNVMSTATGSGELYKVKQEEGYDYICNDEHILCLVREEDQLEVKITAKEFHESTDDFRSRHRGYKMTPDQKIFYGIEVLPIGKGDYYGFEINWDRKFLLGDFTVTHNTMITSQIIGEIKTAPFNYYVLTRDLLDQAYDTLSSTLNVPIGRIGAGHFDIRDINVCTVQSVVRSINMDSSFKISDYMFDNEEVWDDDDILSYEKNTAIKKLLGATKGVYLDECVTGDTILRTEIGPTRIDQIESNLCKYVISFDGEKAIYNKILKWMDKGVRGLIRLRVKDGKMIKCTKDHPIYTPEGWKKAGEMVVGDKVLVFCDPSAPLGDCIMRPIVSIEAVGDERVYDISVEKDHCFFGNGILVHNCHHASSKMCVDVMAASPNAYWRFGGTATPYREDNAEIVLQGLFGRKIVDISASYLIDKGYLLTPYILFDKIHHEDVPNQYAAVYSHCVTKNEEFHEHVAKTANHLISRGLSTLILVQHYAHGEALKKLIPNTPFVTGKMSGKKRKQCIQDLRDKKIMCMIATTLADEGLDIPTLDAALLAGGGASSTRVNQRVGRTLRPDRSSEFPRKKSIVVVYDHKARFLDNQTRKVRKLLKAEKKFNLINSSGGDLILDEIDEIMGTSDQGEIFEI